MRFAKIGPRLHQSYFMQHRMAEYRTLLKQILEHNYRFLTACQYATLIRDNNPPNVPVCILRVDVDTDPCGAGRMFEVEQELGVRSTYYFRLSTIDRALIARVALHGSEAGYHFEELSTLAHHRGLRRGFDIALIRDELRRGFRNNVERFCELTGVTPRTVAAHGDFLNRRLGVMNNAFVDRQLLDEVGIIAEISQIGLWQRGTARVADRPAPVWWQPCPPQIMLKKSPPVLWLVLHPRQWIGNWRANLRADLSRAFAEAEYMWNRLTAATHA